MAKERNPVPKTNGPGRDVSLCPWCHAPVPAGGGVAPYRLDARRGRLSARGYVVEVSDRGFWTHLEVHTPARTLYKGTDLGRRWTARGAVFFLIGPPLLGVVTLALFLPDPAGWGAILVPALLAAAGCAGVAVHALWRSRQPSAERVIDEAWRLLVPRLHADGFAAADAAFLAALAEHSQGRGSRVLRAAALRDALGRTERAVEAGACPPSYLAWLHRLHVADMAAGGSDPARIVAELLGRCLRGRLPLAFAGHLLDGWEPPWLTPGLRARLRVLVCDGAFEAGYEVGNLADAGRTAPALGELLRVADGDGLAALRLVWSLRPTRPWDRLGDVTTAFALAPDPASEPVLARHPDLLLRQADEGWKLAADGRGPAGPAEVVLTPRGLVVQGVAFAEVPRSVEVTGRGGASEMRLGGRRFTSPRDLGEFAPHLERWFRYGFGEFLAVTGPVRARRSPERAAMLRAWGAVECPNCRQPLLPRPGEVGLALDEPA